jgi:hypothetical protein
MLKLAICDDQLELIEKLKNDLHKIFIEIGSETKIEVYGRGEDLQSDLINGEIFNLILQCYSTLIFSVNANMNEYYL